MVSGELGLSWAMMMKFFWTIGVVMLVAAPVGAQDDTGDGDAAIEAGRDALRDTGSYPWYDSAADEVRRIEVPAKKAKSASKNNNSTNSTTGASSPSMFASGDWFTPLAWVGIALLLAALIYLLVRMYLLREYHAVRAADAESDEDTSDEVARVEDLPVKIRRSVSDLLSEANRHYEAGNFAEAIVYYYSHQLVQLDRRQLIRLTKGKTNRQYLRELPRRTGLADLLSQSVRMFEDVFFGRHALSRERFEAVWRRQEEFDSLLEQAGA